MELNEHPGLQLGQISCPGAACVAGRHLKHGHKRPPVAGWLTKTRNHGYVTRYGNEPSPDSCCSPELKIRLLKLWAPLIESVAVERGILHLQLKLQFICRPLQVTRHSERCETGFYALGLVDKLHV